MTREEELITRWIDDELRDEDQIDFKKLHDSNPELYDSFKEVSGISNQVLKENYESEKEIPTGVFLILRSKRRSLRKLRHRQSIQAF